MNIRLIVFTAITGGILLGVGGIYTLSGLVTLQEPTPQVVAKEEVSAPTPPTRDELLRLVNEERAKVGVQSLVIDERLNGSAQQKADDMFVNNYESHVDKNGLHGYEIAHEYAPDCIYTGENLYWGKKEYGQMTSRSAMYAWMLSPSHATAIKDPKNTRIGFGIADNNVVQHFCQL